MHILHKIALALDLSLFDVLNIVRSAPYRYKVYPIKKRTSNNMRIIAQPSRELKTIQRWLINEELSYLPIHDSVTAYQKGASIKNNAIQHVSNNYLLKLDFSDFFPSIKPIHFLRHLSSNDPTRYKVDEIEIINKLLFWYNKREKDMQLSIGAPSSPFISNTIMHEFDSLVSDICKLYEVTYTRYADDLTFSCNEKNILFDLKKQIINALQLLSYPRITINDRKTVFTSKKHHRAVTGLILSSQNKLSIGRERKRLIRSMIHHFTKNILDDEQVYKLKGLLAFAKDIEPTFLKSMKDKYSDEVINSIFSYNPDN